MLVQSAARGLEARFFSSLDGPIRVEIQKKNSRDQRRGRKPIRGGDGQGRAVAKPIRGGNGLE